MAHKTNESAYFKTSALFLYIYDFVCVCVCDRAFVFLLKDYYCEDCMRCLRLIYISITTSIIVNFSTIKQKIRKNL